MEIQTLFKSDSGNETATIQVSSVQEALQLLDETPKWFTDVPEEKRYKWLNATSHPSFTIPWILKDENGFPDTDKMMDAYRLYRRWSYLFTNERDNWLFMEELIRQAFEKYVGTDKGIKRFKIVEGDFVTWVWYFQYTPDFSKAKDFPQYATYYGISSSKYSDIASRNPLKGWRHFEPEDVKAYTDKLQNTFNKEKNNRDKSKD